MGICLVMMIGEVGASRGLPNHAAAKSGGARRGAAQACSNVQYYVLSDI